MILHHVVGLAWASAFAAVTGGKLPYQCILRIAAVQSIMPWPWHAGA